MPETLRTPAIVLKRKNLREADRIVTLFTRARGKVSAVGRGVRKPTSKLAGHLELGTVADVSFVEGRGDLYTITAARGVMPMLHIGHAIDVLPVFTHMLEVSDRMTQDEEPDTRLFDLLATSLQQLDTCIQQEQPRMAALRTFFDLSFLNLLGLLPELRVCVSCRKDLQQEDHYMSLLLGGVLCPLCSKEDTDALDLSVTILKLLRYFSDVDADRAVMVPVKTQASLFFLLDRMFAHLISRQTSSSKFRRAVDRLPSE